MIPFLTYPLALIALASLPALTAIYILRNRFRRRHVSSLVLWRFRIQSTAGGAKVHRLQLPLIYFLELLALLLLVVAASAPHWKLPQATRPLIVVLDDSWSMRAMSENISAQNRARVFLEKLFRSQPPPAARLVLAGAEPRLLGAPAKDWSEVRPLLDQWTCWSPASSLENAITLASGIGKQEANILVLTDHAPPDTKVSNDRLQWRAFGAPLENVAIVNASRTANGEQDRCLIEIANLSDKPREAGLSVQADSNVVQKTSLSLAPNERRRVVFNVPASVGRLEAALGADALAEDDSVRLLPPIRRRVRVQVALTNTALSALIERTLAATGLRAAISDDPELVIHHSDASPGSNAWSVRWTIPAKASAYTGPFVIDGSHPLAQGISLAGTVWAASAMTNPPGAVPVILAGNVPLLSVSEDVSGRQFLTLNLDPGLSTIQTTPDWPVLFWNILEWRLSQFIGLHESNARLGTEVTAKTAGEPVTVVWPNGTVKSFPRTGDQLAIETPLPGLYSIVTGSLTNLLAVNPLAADESDLRACATGQWGRWRDDPEHRFAQRPMAWIFALGALGLLTAHLCLLTAGKGGN